MPNIFQTYWHSLGHLLGQIAPVKGSGGTPMGGATLPYTNLIGTPPGINAEYMQDVAMHLAFASLQKYKPSPTIKVLGAENISFQEVTIKSDKTNTATNALTQVTLDTTSYPDKAIIKLKNDRGFDVYLLSIALDGTLIYQYSGKNGEILHDGLRNDDDIRRNGENCLEIGNDYITTGAQATKIADYWWKFAGKKKHVYALTIAGTALWYEPGDWYTFTLGGAGQNEYIDTVVEVYSVDVQRSATDIGTTNLVLREVEESWAKTTLYTARAVSGGSPKRRVNRSNIVTVASSTYDGAYDYRCDGTADDVQIQAAIDYVSQTWGGGTVILTSGAYTVADSIVPASNIKIIGDGTNTILYPASASVTTVIDFGSVTNSSAENIVIDGLKASITFTTDGMAVIDGNQDCRLSKVIVRNYAMENTSGGKSFYLIKNIIAVECTGYGNKITNSGITASLNIFASCDDLASCVSTENESVGSLAILSSFASCTNLSACTSKSNASGGTSGWFISFSTCKSLSSCYSYSNSTGGVDGDLYSFFECDGLTACVSESNATTGNGAEVYSFKTCTNISSCASKSNTTSGTGAVVYSFDGCTRVTVSSTSGNASTATSEYGFNSCKSVQQCKASGDSTPYNASYADSGTSNACADTYQGGFNS